MKISEVNTATLANYLRLSEVDYTETELEIMMAAAKSYIEQYTGIPASSEDGEILDDYEDLTIAYLAICQDMYDNRGTVSPSSASAGINRTMDTIMGMHARNLVC